MIISNNRISFTIDMRLIENDALQTGLDGAVAPLDRFEVLETLLSKRYGVVAEAADVKRFRSKKNIVFSFRVGNDHLVAKLFLTEFFTKELEQLLLCAKNGVSVPTVLGAEDGVILMSYVAGRPLVDVLNETFSVNTTKLLAEWYNEYHSVSGRIKGDPRLRNFIFDDSIIGIDFEESSSGSWIKDIGGVAASILDTDPIGDARKYQLVWNLFETYLSLSKLELTPHLKTVYSGVIANTLEKTALWRKSTELLSLARTIRISGLPQQ
ncbi:MAG: hypothetical protein GF411_00780 [Candidatus Lokiarchaeota archaeon]|nr:hypothetical protein [Candidatus Lokiarchaeota archaeon]